MKIEKCYNTGTNCEAKNFTSKDMENLLSVSEQLQTEFVQNFIGVPVRIDEKLEGNQHYVAVSKELYKQIIICKSAKSV